MPPSHSSEGRRAYNSFGAAQRTYIDTIVRQPAFIAPECWTAPNPNVDDCLPLPSRSDSGGGGGGGGGGGSSSIVVIAGAAGGGGFFLLCACVFLLVRRGKQHSGTATISGDKSAAAAANDFGSRIYDDDAMLMTDIEPQ